jgi:hypothetical protein
MVTTNEMVISTTTETIAASKNKEIRAIIDRLFPQIVNSNLMPVLEQEQKRLGEADQTNQCPAFRHE